VENVFFQNCAIAKRKPLSRIFILFENFVNV
jgi:hypothetical protein